MAPLLALAGMRLDGWLAPALGPHATARLYNSLERGHEAAMAWARQSPLMEKLGAAAGKAAGALQKLLVAAPEQGAGGVGAGEGAGAGGEGEGAEAGDGVGGTGGRAGLESGIVALWGRFLDGVAASARYAWRRVERGEVAELAAEAVGTARRWLGAGSSGGSSDGSSSEGGGGAPPPPPGLLASENALMAAMTVALVIVLVVRRRRLAGRTA